MSGVNEIRSSFLDYFSRNGHEPVASSPLVPRNDPTLMFTNAGMVQFKNVFTGREKRPYSRAATSQKCVRAGGKHNDLDNVGYTARHHTFFEMLGNFSFGDYFKERRDRACLESRDEGPRPAEGQAVLATVYRDDDEAFDLWKKIAVLPEPHHPVRREGQFLGHGRHRSVRPVLGDLLRPRRRRSRRSARLDGRRDGDRYVEIWNLVFMQYERWRAASASTCPGPRSIPAWGSSASPRCCRACTQLRHRSVPP